MIMRAGKLQVGSFSLVLPGPADLRHFDDFPLKKLPAAEDGQLPGRVPVGEVIENVDYKMGPVLQL